ncbi:MAG: putative toxin-antitoxin system toxin component, PIN family [Blastocatellia bacterium]
MRIVLDTDVIVAAMRSAKGASRRLLVLLDEGKFEALASVSLMIEYEAVLKRPENLSATGLMELDIEEFINALATMIIPVEIFYLWRPVLKDPNDEFVFETAINGQADAIVTFNTKDYKEGARRFSVEILTPGELLRRLE